MWVEIDSGRWIGFRHIDFHFFNDLERNLYYKNCRKDYVLHGIAVCVKFDVQSLQFPPLERKAWMTSSSKQTPPVERE
jgi:hypothetical protein